MHLLLIGVSLDFQVTSFYTCTQQEAADPPCPFLEPPLYPANNIVARGPFCPFLPPLLYSIVHDIKVVGDQHLPLTFMRILYRLSVNATVMTVDVMLFLKLNVACE